jgi:hypothetical protein
MLFQQHQRDDDVVGDALPQRPEAALGLEWLGSFGDLALSYWKRCTG